MCKISVVVPVYKCEATLEKCLESVLNQSFKDFELIIINDGSPDNSDGICRRFAQKDSRIKYIRRENGGVASVRNLGLETAKGEYLCYIDSDDYIEEETLSFMYKVACEENSDIVICGYFIENGKSRLANYCKSVTVSGDEINSCIVELKSKNLIDANCNKLYRLSFLRESGVRYPLGEYYEDTYFNLKLLEHKPKISVKEECFYHYVFNMGSITRRYNENKLAAIKERARLLKGVTRGVDAYCDFYFIKSVFSSFMDMFLSLPKKQIKEYIKQEITAEEFINAASNAEFSGVTAKLIISTARSKSVIGVYLFCLFSYLLKYKMQKIFSRVKNK